MKQNPKLKGSNLFDCKSQIGLCPRNCSQCYYNHLGADNVLVKEPYFPTLDKTVENGIVRVNSMHDSNLNRDDVISDSSHYKRRFFNTSIPNFDFPDPVVYTANCSEEDSVVLHFLNSKDLHKIMFVRLRVSATNLNEVEFATAIILTNSDLPVVWTLMKYYSTSSMLVASNNNTPIKYVLQNNLKHERWTPTKAFKEELQILINEFQNRRVTLCGTIFSELCKDCKNCETYYYQTKKRMTVHNL